VKTTFEYLHELASAAKDRGAKAREVAEVIRAARGFHWVGVYDVSPTEIAVIGWTGADPPAFPRFPISRGLNGAAVASREHVVVQDVSNDPRYLTTFGSTRAEAIFLIFSPLDGHILGTIDVESDRPNAFAPEMRRFYAVAPRLLRRCGHNTLT
jgi:L-methionine (R)-S-oxide reductase